MEFVFAYLAGLLTLINPCVLPVLPIVLVSALNARKSGPVALALGLSVSFVAFGLFVTAFGAGIGLSQERLSHIGALMMIGFGLLLWMPRLARPFEHATAGMARGAETRLRSLSQETLLGQFSGGVLLGMVWSPCIGPTLGGAIALASQGENLGYAALIMSAFSAGVSSVIIVLGLGAREAIQTRATALRALAGRSKSILGATFIVVGILLLFDVHHFLEALALQIMPEWLQDLSVKY